MKKYWKITGMILALALALTLGMTALAENAEAPAAEPPATDAAAGADTALQDALNADRPERRQARRPGNRTEILRGSRQADPGTG